MTEREALKLALEALKRIDEVAPTAMAKLIIPEIEQALAQPEQEYAATISVRWHEPVGKVAFVLDVNLPVGIHKVYTTPPQRTWVGLTDDEIDQGLLRSDYAFKTAEAWRAGVVFAMTKLKEKNT